MFPIFIFMGGDRGGDSSTEGCLWGPMLIVGTFIFFFLGGLVITIFENLKGATLIFIPLSIGALTIFLLGVLLSGGEKLMPDIRTGQFWYMIFWFYVLGAILTMLELPVAMKILDHFRHPYPPTHILSAQDRLHVYVILLLAYLSINFIVLVVTTIICGWIRGRNKS